MTRQPGARRGKVWFVGAGPGAADLLTLRAARVIAEADVVIWAASLVMAEAIAGARPDAEVLESTTMTLEEVTAVYDRAAAQGLTVARVHSGDPALYGAVGEQIERCDARGLDWEIVPGVSSLGAAAAVLGRELTVPEVAQSVIITRLPTATPMPAGEDVRAFARHGTTLALFLSAKRGRRLQEELLAGGYAADTPCAVVYRATWPDEAVYRCRLDALAATLRDARLHKHTLVLVGRALEAGGTRSHLYDPGHGNEFRRATGSTTGDVSRSARSVSRGDVSRSARSVVTMAELREPDLPRTAKVRTGPLRTGWTTGACAAAAGKAAALVLAGAPAVPREVEIPLPEPFQGRTRVPFAVARGAGGPEGAEAVVVKDAGDDPDVTDGAHVTVHLAPRPAPGVAFAAGPGVGTVTLPGLGLAVGGPAINPVPRQMIETALREVLDLDTRGLTVTVAVPGGERMARKTTNARLGIVGGISILGTTGVVRPFSTASWRASVEQAVDVMAAQGADTVVLATGGRTERVARDLVPHLPAVCVVEVGDFTGAAIRRAVARGLAHVVFVGMPGKLAKLAGGVLMTHYTRSRVDTALLARLTAEAGGDDDLVVAVASATTARHAYELWRAAGLHTAGSVLCGRVAGVLEAFAGGAVDVRVALVDPDTLAVAARSPGWAGP